MLDGRIIKISLLLLTIPLILALYAYVQYGEVSPNIKHGPFFNISTFHQQSRGITHHHRISNETIVTVKELATKYPIMIEDNVYVIPNKDVCPLNETVKFLLIVHSATDHSEQRQTIRRTWSNRAILQAFNGRLVFILGTPNTKAKQRQIKIESDKFGDIIQGNFIDTYRNLTNKAVLGIRWITENCRQVRYVLKFDDDVFINSIRIFEYLLNVTNQTWTSRAIICYKVQKGRALIQRSEGKWKVDENEFKNHTHWPVTFCRGFFVIMTGDLLPDLYEAAKTTPFLWIDDVYVYGMLANTTRNVTHYDLKHLRRYVRLVNSSDKMYALWNNITL